MSNNNNNNNNSPQSPPSAPKKGFLGRFSAFLASDSLVLNKSNSSSPNQQPQQQQRDRGASIASSPPSNHNSPSLSPSTTGNNHNHHSHHQHHHHHHGGSATTIPRNNSSRTLSPTAGALESGGGSFASSASPSFAHNNNQKEQRGGSSDDGSQPDQSSSFVNNNNNNNNNNNGDVFKMFSIVGPKFSQSAQQDSASSTNQDQLPSYNHATTATSTTTTTTTTMSTTSAARTRLANFFNTADLSSSPTTKPASSGFFSNFSNRQNQNNTNHNSNSNSNSSQQANNNSSALSNQPNSSTGTAAIVETPATLTADNLMINNSNQEKAHHRRKSSIGEFLAGTANINVKYSEEEVQQRLEKLVAFFAGDSAESVSMSQSPETATRTKDILEKIANSDHDLDLALSTLKAAYGLSDKTLPQLMMVAAAAAAVSPMSPLPLTQTNSAVSSVGGEISSSNNVNSNSAEHNTTTTTGVVAVVVPESIRRRNRSQTVARADLMTLLNPILPTEAPLRRRAVGNNEFAEVENEQSETGNQASNPEGKTIRDSALPASITTGASAGFAEVNSSAITTTTTSTTISASASPQRKTFNTGNVHGNRYIAIDMTTTPLPQQWFFFGGCPVVVDYEDSTALVGQQIFISALPTNSHKKNEAGTNSSQGTVSPPIHPTCSSGGADFGIVSSRTSKMSFRDQEIIKINCANNNNKNSNEAVGEEEEDDDDEYGPEQILQLVNEQIDRADEAIEKSKKYRGVLVNQGNGGEVDEDDSSDLSSDMSGRSFGSMVDLEEMVRSL